MVFTFAGGSWVSTRDLSFQEDFVGLVVQYGLPVSCESEAHELCRSDGCYNRVERDGLCARCIAEPGRVCR